MDMYKTVHVDGNRTYRLAQGHDLDHLSNDVWNNEETTLEVEGDKHLFTVGPLGLVHMNNEMGETKINSIRHLIILLDYIIFRRKR